MNIIEAARIANNRGFFSRNAELVYGKPSGHIFIGEFVGGEYVGNMTVCPMHLLADDYYECDRLGNPLDANGLTIAESAEREG